MDLQPFSERLQKSRYNPDVALDAARFQETVFEFMKLVRNNSLGYPDGEELMDKFCNLVNNKAVWRLAQMVVPEFRSLQEERNLASRIPEHTEGEKHVCLSHVVNKLSFLPASRSESKVLVTEQDLVVQRHRSDVEYLVTKGRGRWGATSSELDDIEDSHQQIQGEMNGKR